jgi:hypothetical protein
MRKKFQVYNHNSKACGVFVVFYKGITTLWESIACPKRKLMEWHNQVCLYGECLDCGIDQKLSFFPIELAGKSSNLVEWK